MKCTTACSGTLASAAFRGAFARFFAAFAFFAIMISLGCLGTPAAPPHVPSRSGRSDELDLLTLRLINRDHRQLFGDTAATDDPVADDQATPDARGPGC